MTAATTDMVVTIDDTIRAEPELFRAAESATRYLDEQLARHPEVFGDDRALTWQYQREHLDGPRVAVLDSEADALGHRSQQRWLQPGELLDPTHRDVQMLRLFQDVLGQRWRQQDAITQAHLRALDAEE
jgi:hypothetical protein